VSLEVEERHPKGQFSCSIDFARLCCVYSSIERGRLVHIFPRKQLRLWCFLLRCAIHRAGSSAAGGRYVCCRGFRLTMYVCYIQGEGLGPIYFHFVYCFTCVATWQRDYSPFEVLFPRERDHHAVQRKEDNDVCVRGNKSLSRGRCTILVS